jgi:hypothetical protein
MNRRETAALVEADWRPELVPAYQPPNKEGGQHEHGEEHQRFSDHQRQTPEPNLGPLATVIARLISMITSVC